MGPVSPERQWEEIGEQEDDGVEDERADESQGEEAAEAKVIKAECTPSKQEIEKHMATHMPFRSWCPFCVAGKAVSSGHHHKPEGPGSVPVISIDYAFMGKGQVNEAGVEEGSEEGSQNPLIVL